MKRKTAKTSMTQPLTAMPIAVDLIRFEKNLLQMGFFGAHDTRYKTDSTRRIEQIVNRDGQKMKIAAEFRASEELGLPSTADRDKYIAFMRIAMEQKIKHGALENPVRFTGYHLLKELGLTYSGENYDDINRWGKRMVDTSITSEQVIFLPARKKYMNKTVHVFRSFTRSGESKSDGSSRVEAYEVLLEDWLLENLNQSYVVPEDFNAYRTLKRPTAKGVFGYLHLWFHASQGRSVDKDYAELCMMLNVPVYKHVSKIKETMGRSLDELRQIGYLASWDIKPMMSKEGYKLVLEAGEEVLRVLAISKRKQLGNTETPSLNAEQTEALGTLTNKGISSAKANVLLQQYAPQVILDQAEYADALISRDKRRKIQNPAGFLIYIIENEVPIPSDFITTRRQRQLTDELEKEQELRSREYRLQDTYFAFVKEEVDRAITGLFPGDQLHTRLKEIIKQRRRTDEMFDNLLPTQQTQMAEHQIWQEVKERLPLPSFESWYETHSQIGLF
jgi:hypothetical protein